MAAKQISNKTKEEYIKTLLSLGEEGFYKKSVGIGICRSTEFKDIDVEILNLAEGFFTLYRRTADENCLIVGKVLRRVAHAINRQLLKLASDKKPDPKRFLTLVV